MTLDAVPPMPTADQWRYIAQLLSDMTTSYKTRFDGALDAFEQYDRLAETAHGICVDLQIPYGDPSDEDEEDES